MLSANPSARTAAVLLACCTEALVGCTSWQTQTGELSAIVAPAPTAHQRASSQVPGLAASTAAPPTPAALDTLDRIRVTTTSGAAVVLRHPRVSSDTLFGTPGKDGPVTAFPLDEISYVQVRGLSVSKTLGLIGLVGVGLVLGSAIALSQMCVMC